MSRASFVKVTMSSTSPWAGMNSWRLIIGGTPSVTMIRPGRRSPLVVTQMISPGLITATLSVSLRMTTSAQPSEVWNAFAWKLTIVQPLYTGSRVGLGVGVGLGMGLTYGACPPPAGGEPGWKTCITMSVLAAADGFAG